LDDILALGGSFQHTGVSGLASKQYPITVKVGLDGFLSDIPLGLVDGSDLG
jgi:hypothetical protein